ncbi:MAG: MarR family transcriptional regulator [Polaromonas sp.]|nr:MarR family transcriptional regulator [Polaromonas sp.]
MVELDRTLSYRLHQLHKLTDVASQRAYLAGTGLTMGAGRCLTAVGSFAPLSVNDLACKANLTKGQASRAAQSLVDQGLVCKSGSLNDSRCVVLTLTGLGETVWLKAMKVVEQRNDEIFGVLAPSDRRQLSLLFDQLLAKASAGDKGLDRLDAEADCPLDQE